MMKSESNLVIEVWESVRDYIPAARRVETATSIIKAFVEFGFEQEDFSDVVDEDDILTEAYNEYFDEGEEEYDGSEDDNGIGW